VAPTEDFPVVDGMFASNANTFEFRLFFFWQKFRLIITS
jgi:hypothetical protein